LAVAGRKYSAAITATATLFTRSFEKDLGASKRPIDKILSMAKKCFPASRGATFSNRSLGKSFGAYKRPIDKILPIAKKCFPAARRAALSKRSLGKSSLRIELRILKIR
jgi:hypothetical protein